jgi:hypothetical protein
MPGNPIGSIDDLRSRISDPQKIRADRFSILKDLCQVVNEYGTNGAAQELILRALEHRGVFGPYASILNALVREVGLFPYVDMRLCTTADMIAHEVHRPRNLPDGIVFHRPQAQVYRALLGGENVVLSAPTSFGKSLVIDAVIAGGKLRNVMVVVPTIALIDETRRRLSGRFGRQFKVITHTFQHPADKNIYVFTQERALEHENFQDIDLFVIDEFYKLSPSTSSDDRWILLNLVFSRVITTGRQFYLLGPNVGGITDTIAQLRPHSFFLHNYSTVVSELHRVPSGPRKIERLQTLCLELRDPTIIFCSSPARAADVAVQLASAKLGRSSTECTEAANWVGENYHPEWHLAVALRRGIGVHHGRIPRALAHYQVRALNKGTIRILVCTSTLIEGVNTSARNIIIYDNKINRNQIDLFTFNNISGRAGRMFRHFIGHVFVFDDPPTGDLPFVDVPAISQGLDAPEELLIQLDEDLLRPRSKEVLTKFEEQDYLEYSTLKANVGIDPQAQLALAQAIASNPRAAANYLSWTGIPTQPQLLRVCELIWEYFDGAQLGGRSVSSVRQLAYFLRQLQARPRIRKLINDQREFRADKDANAAVQQVLDFLRLWAGFHFPRLLLALDRIQRDVFSRAGIRPGNYEVYASRVENYFLDQALVALDEYGVPLELARKIEPFLQPNGDLDEVLRRLKAIDVRSLNVSRFERQLVVDAQESLQ